MKQNTKTPLQKKLDTIQEQRKQQSKTPPRVVLDDSMFILDEFEDIEEKGY